MKPNDAFRALVDSYPDGQRALSRAIGRSAGWASSMLNNDGSPRLDTFAKVAEACGYEVVIRDKGTGDVLAVVEPPEG